MDYFYERYFAPQNVTPMNKIFSPEHFILTTVCFLFIFLILYLQYRKQDINYSSKMLRILAAIMLLFEIFRISWQTYYHGFDLRNIRFDWCNQVCLTLPFIVLFQWKKAYPFIDILAVIGGFVVLIYPLWIFYDYGGIHIMAVQSMFSHALMLLIPLSMPFTGDYKRNIHNVWKPLVGGAILCFVAFVMAHVLNENYLIMLAADGIPVFDRIPYPWYWLLAAPAMIAVISAVTKLLSYFDGWLVPEKRLEEIR